MCELYSKLIQIFIFINKDPVRRAIFEDRIEPKGAKKSNWFTIEEGIQKMRKGHFAFHVETGSGYKIVQETFEEDEKCDFQEIDYLNQFCPHLVTRRRSPYVELLKVGYVNLYYSSVIL